MTCNYSIWRDFVPGMKFYPDSRKQAQKFQNYAGKKKEFFGLTIVVGMYGQSVALTQSLGQSPCWRLTPPLFLMHKDELPEDKELTWHNLVVDKTIYPKTTIRIKYQHLE